MPLLLMLIKATYFHVVISLAFPLQKNFMRFISCTNIERVSYGISKENEDDPMGRINCSKYDCRKSLHERYLTIFRCNDDKKFVEKSKNKKSNKERRIK